MKEISLNPNGRLMAVASYVRKGSAVADIGTDHAYLPIQLVGNGTVLRALASDVVDGPLEKARANIAAYRMTDKIEVRKADGLAGIESFAPDDIIIAGMGGELIARIIEDAPYTKNNNVRLILQPMTKADVLREYLTSSGYEITDETLCKEDDRVYQIICANYTGVPYEYTKCELLCGRHNLEKKSPLLCEHITRTSQKLNDRINGLKTSGKTAEDEEKILCELNNYMQSLKN